MATRQNWELSVAALRVRFCDRRLKKHQVLSSPNLFPNFETDSTVSFSKNLQTKVIKTYLNASPPPALPLDAHAQDAAAEQTPFDKDTVRVAKTIPSAQEARSAPLRLQFIKNKPNQLLAKLLDCPENTRDED